VAGIRKADTGESAIYDAISEATARLAEKIEADVIICQTATGMTATKMASERPNVPIVSVTSNVRVANQLALIYANSAFVRPYSEHFGMDLAKELKESGYLKLKDGEKDLLAVIVSGDKNRYGTDTVMVRKF
jgi:pyruvate kinase